MKKASGCDFVDDGVRGSVGVRGWEKRKGKREIEKKKEAHLNLM